MQKWNAELRRHAEERVHARHDRRVERRRDGADPERARRQHEVLARGQDGVGPARRLGEGEHDAGHVPHVVRERRRPPGSSSRRAGCPRARSIRARPGASPTRPRDRAPRTGRSAPGRSRPGTGRSGGCRRSGARTAASKQELEVRDRDRVRPEPPDRPLGEHRLAHRHAEPPVVDVTADLLRAGASPCAGPAGPRRPRGPRRPVLDGPARPMIRACTHRARRPMETFAETLGDLRRGAHPLRAAAGTWSSRPRASSWTRPA